ncbi:MAG: hypothetical protein ACKOZU_01140 [Planctomycetaceae bacterium]
MSVPRTRRLLLAALAAPAAILGAAVAAADVPAGLAGSGATLVPADAAFLSATLRAREQYDLLVGSNAWASLRSLPAVQRALDSLEEQRSMPGSPLSIADAFLSLPENAEALDLLADMVATDTFVYGEPSCATFARLVRKLAAVTQTMGGMGDDGVILDEEMDVLEDAGGGEAAARRRARRMRCQFGVEAGDLAGALQSRLLVQTLVDNADLLVMPDVVWGFRTTKPKVAKDQVARLEKLAEAAIGGGDSPVDVARRQVAGGDFLVITVRGESLPWGELERGLADDAGDIDGFDQAFAKLRTFDLCVALGVVGDRVILSLGDSTEHLAKLGNGKAGLLGVPALAPVVAHADRKLTAISYASADMIRALAQSPEDVASQLESLDEGLGAAGLSGEAVEEAADLVERFAAALAARLPEPGPWTAVSWLGDSGYEGQTWDWSRNQPLDGARRLDLLEHAGGAPLGVLVVRRKPDPKLIDDVCDFVGGLWSLVQEHGLPSLDAAEQDRAEEVAERLGPLAERLADAVRRKVLPSLADGQVGLVLDAKSRSKKPQRDLPASADPLPLPELAIVLPLKDAKLFRDGLNDLFALGDEAAKALREIDPDAVPQGVRIPPDPEKSKVDKGTVWSFAAPGAGLDEQLRPAIGVGEHVAVFSLAPKQAARLLDAAKLETGSQVGAFEEPLAGAAALDFAGLVDAVEPWLVYLARYACVSQRDGAVDPEAELQASDETVQARDGLKTVDVVLDVARCLRAAVAETNVRDGAVVTRWRNVIRDLPKK